MQGIIDSILIWTLAVDWVESVKDWAVIFKDLATGGAAIFAILKFNSWKKEIEYKKRNEIATTLQISGINLYGSFSKLETERFGSMLVIPGDDKQKSMAALSLLKTFLLVWLHDTSSALEKFNKNCSPAYVLYGTEISTIQRAMNDIFFTHKFNFIEVGLLPDNKFNIEDNDMDVSTQYRPFDKDAIKHLARSANHMAYWLDKLVKLTNADVIRN